MKKYLIKMFLLFILVGSTQAKELIKVAYLEWGSYSGVKLKDNGIIVDIVKTTLEHAGYEVQVKILPWSRAVEFVRKGVFDINAGFWRGPKWDGEFDYMDNISIDSSSFIVMSNSALKSGSFENLKGKRIGVLLDANYGERFLKHESFKKVSVNHQKSAIEMLERGRVDAIIGDPVIINDILKSDLPHLQGKLRVLKPAVSKYFLSPGIAKNHPKKDEIINRFNKSYRKLVKDGLYKNMFKKHGVKLTSEYYLSL